MIQVGCPSCSASYSLDERRVPPSGQKMRCPKCSSTFLVHPSGETSAAPAQPGNPKKTMMGVGPKPSVPAPSTDASAGSPDPAVAPMLDAPMRATPFDAFDMPSAAPASERSAPAPTSKSFGDDDDLPGLKSDLELDLPSPRAAQGPSWSADLPAPKSKPSTGPATPSPAFDLDLPAPKMAVDRPAPHAAATASSFDLDLPGLKSPPPPTDRAPAPASKPPVLASKPAPAAAALDGWGSAAGSAGSGDLSLGGLDMPEPSKAPTRSLGELDLPGADAPLLELDLPPIAGQEAADAASASVPSAFGDFELPMPKSVSDLPPKAAPGQPKPSERPDKRSGGPMRGSDLPPIGPAAPQIKATGVRSAPPLATGVRSAPPLAPSVPPPLSAPTLTSTLATPRAPEPVLDSTEVSEAEIPGTGTFKVGGPTGAFEMQPMAAEVGETDLPAEAEVPVPGVDDRSIRRARPGVAERKRSRAPLMIVSGIALAALVAGVLVGTLTDHGYFGIYWFERLTPAVGDPGQVQAAVREAEEMAKSDSFEDVRKSLRRLAETRRVAGLNRTLLARSLLHESLYQVRFGEDAASTSRAAAILGRIDERGGQAPGMPLARAADALRRGALVEVPSFLQAAAAESPTDPYTSLVAGELALRENAPDRARAAFERASAAGVRSTWGVARSLMLAGDPSAGAVVDRVLERSPRHAEARLAKALAAWRGADSDAAVAYVREVTGEVPVAGAPLKTSRQARANAWTLLGRVQEGRGDRWRARTAYETALQWDSLRVDALLGAGRLLLAEERFQEAMLRFQAAAGAAGAVTALPGPLEQPFAVQAKLGEARALLGLDRVQDARAALEALRNERPEDAAIALWLGKADEASGERLAAETNYRRAIEFAPDDFAAYLALSQLYFATERKEDAAAILATARERVRESPSMRRMLGQSELVRDRPAAALEEFRRALELDPTDVEALFGRGVALRRLGRVDEAAAAFSEVAAKDASWPGLALERGMLFEARGLAGEAVAAYRVALQDRPDDPDLLIRLSSAEVSAGHYEAAEASIRRVAEVRPNSAEAEYLLGRVAFARSDVPTALKHFERAVSLDGTRGEFFMYFSWALLEAGSIGSALDHVQSAIERDASQAEAFVVRGRIRLRTGAVRDALEDLAHALELNPGRQEAYAYMGEAHDQLRNEDEAIRSYRKALEFQPERGEWWYRLGRLLFNSTSEREATRAFERATTLGAAERLPPAWLVDAHRRYGDGLRKEGNREEAIKHYRRYLAMAANDAVDRADVAAAMRSLGAEE